jgi:hypothetical protein
MIKLSFKPKQVVKKVTDVLPDRSKDVIIQRYGLGIDTHKMTLEAIGSKYGITRERVRQIEENSISNIRKSTQFLEFKNIFEELHNVILELGGVISEKELLDHFSHDESTRNYIHFLLVLGNEFKKCKEDDCFVHRWTIDQKLATQIEDSIQTLYKSLTTDQIVSESEIITDFLTQLKEINTKYKNDEIIKRWLNISKKIERNPLGEWGRSDSPNINVKGIRDYAYLIIRRHGSPIHFREVAQQINKTFEKKAHVATCHNELIKDPRFVLVGRGLYALKDWGYATGVVRDVISEILAKHGPLTKDEIISKVLKERYVKENTILVNLQNPTHFIKDKEGRYSLTK